MAATAAPKLALRDEREAMRLLARRDAGREAHNAALTFLIAAWYGPMLRLARRLLRAWHGARPAQDAEDVVQEAFVILFYKADAYDPHYAFVPWLRTLVRRRASSCLRRVRRRQVRMIEAVGVPACGRSPLEQLMVRDLLDHLPAEERELVEAHYLERECVADIARRHQRTPSQIYQLLYRSRGRLRRLEPGRA
jgi:RNA polymerase sigma factor (sigma-70 family)